MVVQQATNELYCPLVKLTQNEKGDVVQLECQGRGRLEHRNEETNQNIFEAEWQKQLTMKPDSEPNSPYSVIEILQRAILRQPHKKSGMVADRIRLWIDPEKLSLNPKAERKKQKEKKTPPSDVVKRMKAEKNIAIVSPMLEGEIEDTIEILFFPKSPQRIVKANTNQQTARTKNGNEKKEGSTWNQPMVLAAKNVELRVEIPEPEKTTTKKSSDKDDDDPFIVTDVVTSGDVELDIYQPKLDQPLKVGADWLHLQNGQLGDQRLSLEGRPAYIADGNRGFRIEGDQVEFDRQRNRAQVNTPGIMQMPVSNSLDGKKLDKPELLSVSWNEQMIFRWNPGTFSWSGQKHVGGRIDELRGNDCDFESVG